MSEIHLKVCVPRNRYLEGRLRIEIDYVLIKEIRVLARGMINRDQFEDRGNTPTGEYDGSLFQSTDGLNHAMYGPYGKVRLRPLSGNALIADKIFGRFGLLIHGGEFSRYGVEKLKNTFGCLRVANEDMKFIRHIIQDDLIHEHTGHPKHPPHHVKVTVVD